MSERTRGRTPPSSERFLAADARAGDGRENLDEPVAIDAVTKVGGVEIEWRSDPRHHKPDRRNAELQQIGRTRLEAERRAQDGGADWIIDGIGRHVRMGEPWARSVIPTRHFHLLPNQHPAVLTRAGAGSLRFALLPAGSYEIWGVPGDQPPFAPPPSEPVRVGLSAGEQTIEITMLK